jgi:hypothetical protein
MPPRKHVAPELMAECKILYEDTMATTDEIGARMGLSRSAFYLRVKEWGWQRRRYSSDLMSAATPILPDVPAETAQRDAQTGDAANTTERGAVPETRAEIYARACKAVGKQIDIIERVQATLLPAHALQSERSVRVLSILNKALLEITEMSEPEESVPDDTDDDPIPQDIDEFRRELARRIRGLVDAERAAAGPGAGGGGSEGA